MVNSYFVLLAIVEIPAYLFHLSLLILLFAKRHHAFKGPFFNIFRIVVIFDFLSFINMIFLRKLSLIPFLIPFYQNCSTLFPAIVFNISSYTTIVQFFGHTLMAFNRFTLAWFPFHYKQFWEKRWYIIMLICLPFLHICWRLHEPGVFKYLGNDIVVVNIGNKSVVSIGNAMAISIYAGTTFVAAILNIFAFTKLHSQKRTSHSININDKSLLSVSFVFFIAQMLRTLHPILQWHFSANDSIVELSLMFLPLINDLYALSGTVTLLILSAKARKAYMSFYFKQKYTTAFKLTVIPSHLPNA